KVGLTVARCASCGTPSEADRVPSAVPQNGSSGPSESSYVVGPEGCVVRKWESGEPFRAVCRDTHPSKSATGGAASDVELQGPESRSKAKSKSKSKSKSKAADRSVRSTRVVPLGL